MESSIQLFTNELFGNIRSIIGPDGEPWFVGSDVAKSLGYSNTRDAIWRHVKDREKVVVKLDSLGGPQDTIIISEFGVYSLIFSSKLPAAEQFTDWVKNILKTMRKIGYDKSLEILQNELIKRENQIRFLNQEVSNLHINLLSKQSEEFCTTAWVVYTNRLTPDMKKEAMVYDPGENLDYDKLRENMRNIENGGNYYPDPPKIDII